MFNLFEKKTKWQVLVAYNQGGTDYIVFARKGLKSGMIYFKTTKVTPPFVCSYNFNSTLFDIKKGFDDVLSDGCSIFARNFNGSFCQTAVMCWAVYQH